MLTALNSGLVFPQGIAPGIDASHPAANGCVLSCVPCGVGSFFNLCRGGTPPTITNSAPRVINATMGACTTSSSSSTELWSWSAGPTTTEPAITMARIGMHGGATQFLLTTGASPGNTAGWRLDISANVLRMVSNGGAAKTGPTLVVNTPYFLACSISAGVVNFVARNLVTGQLLSSTTTGTTATASDGTTNIGGGTGNTGAQTIAAASISHTFMTLQMLQAWSENPWSFWYPDYDW